MKITDITAIWLRYNIPPAKQHVSDFGRLQTFDMTLVRVETDEGLTGFGEAKGAVDSAAVCAPIVSCINEELPPAARRRRSAQHHQAVGADVQRLAGALCD